VTDQDIRQGFGDNAQANANLKDLLQHYFDKAEQCYADALAALPAEDRQSLTPSLMMGAIYYAHLAKLKKVDFDVWQHPARLTPLKKIWVAWKAYRYEKKAAKKTLPLRLDF